MVNTILIKLTIEISQSVIKMEVKISLRFIEQVRRVLKEKTLIVPKR